MEKEKKEVIYKIIEYDYKDAKSEQDCFDDCINLLAELKTNLKSENFTQEWMSKLIYWQMARHKIEHIQVKILENKAIHITKSHQQTSLIHKNQMLIHKF